MLKKSISCYKMCHNLKIEKLGKKIFRTDVDLYLLKIFDNFFGKVTSNEGVKVKKKSPTYKSINILSLKFHHLYLKFQSKLSFLILTINEKETNKNGRH